MCYADLKSINRNSDIFKDVYSYYPGAPALCHLECLGTDRCVAAVFTVRISFYCLLLDTGLKPFITGGHW